CLQGFCSNKNSTHNSRITRGPFADRRADLRTREKRASSTSRTRSSGNRVLLQILATCIDDEPPCRVLAQSMIGHVLAPCPAALVRFSRENSGRARARDRDWSVTYSPAR